jgi:phage tail sheath gpL-like
MGVDASAVARVLGIQTAFKDLRGDAAVSLPQRVALVGQGSTASTYATTPVTVSSAAEVGTTFGFGSPLHLAALQCLPVNGDGLGSIPLTVYPMVDPGAGVVATGSITPAGTQVGTANYQVVVNGIRSAEFTINDGDLGTDLEAAITAAINANINMPIIAAAGIDVVDVTSKWQGLSANDLVISVEGPSNGITFGIVQPTGGLGTPLVATALAQIVNVWETLVINCLDVADSTALDAFDTWGEGRWGPLVRKPAVVFTGVNDASPAAVNAITDARKTDRTNCAVQAFGSTSLPLQIAARAATRVAQLANATPPHDYGGRTLTGVFAGADADQQLYTALDASVKAGTSTTAVVDGLVTMLDTVTMYHPDGEDPPAYRYVVDIIKLQNVIFNLSLIFSSANWNGAPLIPDADPTTEPTAKKPKDAVAAVNTKLDALGSKAILSDPATAKKTTVATIDGGNPKRLNVETTVQVSGNTNVVSVDLFFGFFFG